MESTVRETSSIKREIDIRLSEPELAPYIDQTYRKAQQHIQLKGFRKGKVPVSMIKKLYGPSLESDAIEQAIQGEFGRYAESEDIQSVGPPTVTAMQKTLDGGVEFTVTYEVMPDIQLGDYKGLSATKIYHIVSEEELNQELDRLRENFMEREPAESVDNDGFVVTVDLQRMENDEEVADAVSEGVEIYLRRPVNQELKSSLLNTRVDDSFRIDLPTGEGESMMNYNVTVRKIERAVLPELTDEFAVKVTGDEHATPQDLIDLVKGGIESEYERRYSQGFRDELIGRLIEAHHFDVPDTFIDRALESFQEDLKRGPDKQLPRDFDHEKFYAEMRPVAERTVRWALLREQIIEKEELKADEVDFEGLAQMEAQRTGLDVETLLKYFKRSPSTTDRILAEKAIQLMEDYAIVNEVEDRELAAQQPPTPQE